MFKKFLDILHLQNTKKLYINFYQTLILGGRKKEVIFAKFWKA